MRVTAVLRTNPPTLQTRHIVRESEKKRARRNETHWGLRRWSKKLNRFWTELRPARGFVCRNCGCPFGFVDRFGRRICGDNVHMDIWSNGAVEACVNEQGEQLVCGRCMYQLTGKRRNIRSAQQAADSVAALAYLKAYEKAKKDRKI